MKKWIEKFSDPGIEYRPHPFWSWNEELDEEELRRQIRDMKETGHGGFFMHARDGLVTPYMGDKWFDCIRACADEAEKCGLEAWCYDEKGWPSGSAGQKISRADKYNQCRWIKFYPYDAEKGVEGELIAFFAVKPDNGNTYRRLQTMELEEALSLLADDEVLMYGTQFTDKHYIDILNPAVVKLFIEDTYERYDQETKGGLRNGTFHGFFTDEPQYALCKTPWSPVSEEEFVKTYHYSIIDNIPALFIDTPDFAAVRYDYWKMVARLYVESFMKQIYDWCEDHSCKLTGHVMMEDNLLCQIHCTAGCMPSYEYMHIPGVDWLGRGTGTLDFKTNTESNPVVPLQLGSVAAQLGKKHVISEMFAMCGWDVSFSELRYIAEWQFLHGVNLICQHLAPYSLKGTRKNDFPPGMFYQSPWWHEYKVFNDTLSRLGKIMADGKNDPDVLFLHPIHSLWAVYTNNDYCGETPFDRAFMEAVNRLTCAHIRFHFGDETIMSRHARVEDGKLIIGNCTYTTVFLPWLYSLDRSTYELLMQFAEQGGKLASIGQKPIYIDGRHAQEELDKLYAYCTIIGDSKHDLAKYANDNNLCEAKITSTIGEDYYIHYSIRNYEEDGKKLYFFLNTDRRNSHKVQIEIDECTAVELLVDKMEFVSHPIFCNKNGKLVLEVEFAPLESHLFVTGEGIDHAPLATRYEEALDLKLSKQWTVSDKSDPNCYLLEFGKYSKQKDTWSSLKHVSQISKEIGATDNYEPLIKFEFNVHESTDLSKINDIKIVSEFKLPATISLNGVPFELIPDEWWLDHRFHVYKCMGGLKHGTNEIVISEFWNMTEDANGNKRYHNRSDFGAMYLLGNFSIYSDSNYFNAETRAITTYGNFIMTNQKRSMVGGNIVTQGYPFFAGTIVLEQEIEIDDPSIKRTFKFPNGHPYAACARVTVNGNTSDLIAWNDFATDVTPYLKKGTNKIEVALTIGNRNLLGPHHIRDGEPFSVGPGEFTPNNENWYPEKYSFVKTGIGE